MAKRNTEPFGPTEEEVRRIRDFTSPQMPDGSFSVIPEDRLPEVVAVGEATHGSAEQAIARSTLTQNLIKDSGYRVVALEASAAATVELDRALANGSPLSGVETAVCGLRFWTWRVREYLSLFQWIWEWNQQAITDPVRVIGIDPQLPGAALQRLSRARASNLSALSESTGKITSPTESNVEWLRTVQARPYLPLDGSAEGDREILRRGVEYSLAIAAASSAQSSKAVMVVRDKAMADALVSFRADNGNPRVVLLAHNGHVAWGSTANLPTFMGQYLREEYGVNYLAIAQFFGSGRFLAHGPFTYRARLRPRPQSIGLSRNLDLIEHYFNRAHDEPFSVDLAALPNESGTSWAHSEKIHRAIGARVSPVLYRIAGMPIIVARSFDTCIYHPRTEPTTPLSS